MSRYGGRAERRVLTEGPHKRRVLIIPHQPHRNIKVRAVEIARYLAELGQYEVFILTWDLHSKTYRHLPEKILFKSVEILQTATTPHTIKAENGLNWVRFPYLLAPSPWYQLFNQRQVEHFVRNHRIDLVISSNAYHFPMPNNSFCKRIYDVVDDHITPGSGPTWQRTRPFTLGELRKADRITAISYALIEELAKEGFPRVKRLPNGVDLQAFQNVSPDAVTAIRTQYQLDKSFTIGYIGNHGWWAGMPLLLESFKLLQRTVPHARLLIVGPGEELERFEQQAAGNPNIIFTGPIPPAEIAAWFRAIDIGVLPFTLCPFTDNSLPLKVLEYGAAQKQVIANPLKELTTLNFPHIRLLEPDAALWAMALAEIAQNPPPWQAEWDVQIAAYDWPIVLKDLAQLLGGCFHAPAL